MMNPDHKNEITVVMVDGQHTQNPDEQFLVHRKGCSDVIDAPGGVVLECVVPRPVGRAGAEAFRQSIEAVLNVDAADCEGMTLEEYMSEGNGYAFDGGHIRALPCCHNR